MMSEKQNGGHLTDDNWSTNKKFAEKKTVNAFNQDKVVTANLLHSSSSVAEDAITQVTEGNVLSQYDQATVMSMGRQFAFDFGFVEDIELFARAAAVARDPNGFVKMKFLSGEEQNSLYNEINHPWDIPPKLWMVVLAVSLAASTQGADESVISGSNLFFPKYMGIANGDSRSRWLVGLVNSSPYLFCAVVSTFITDPLNRRFGRKRVIFFASVASSVFCLWQGFTNSWYHLLIARACLGAFGIGPNSNTVPVYASEAAPASIRGALGMMWQFFTALGIALGYVISMAFYNVPAHDIGGGLNWRLMLSSAMIPATITAAFVPFIPESPRWLMGKGRYNEAYESLKSIRKYPISAARDMFYQHVLFQEEQSFDAPFWRRFKELFTIRRNRNATIAAIIITFMQQFCGINVIAYYSSSIFTNANFSELSAMGASVGFGFLNAIFALPAFFTIDRYGRRFLLLVTFPFMCIFLLMTGFAFWIPEEHREARLAVICLGIYLYTIFYSFGSGVVTVPYTAECFPMYIRTLGSSIAFGNMWFFNFVLAITWPSMLESFQPQGAFGWYAGWNCVGFFLVLWFLPETKSLTLEELDEVFDVPLLEHAKYQSKELWDDLQSKVLKRKIQRQEPLHRKYRNHVNSTSWDSIKPEQKFVE